MPKAKRKSPAGKGHGIPYKTRRTKCSPTSHRGDPERLPLVQSDTCGSNAGTHLTHPHNTEMIPAGPTSSSPSQPQAFGSFIKNSSNVSINGGDFTSSQLHHTNLTINVGGSATAGSDNPFETNVISVGEVQSYGGKHNGPLASASQGTNHMQGNSGNNLFNICLPEGDPINPETMPLNFKPRAYPRFRDMYVSMEYKTDSYLASSSVESSRHNNDGSPMKLGGELK